VNFVGEHSIWKAIFYLGFSLFFQPWSRSMFFWNFHGWTIT
jgi:hypothetical protein